MSTITIEIDTKAAETSHCCFIQEICTSVVRLSFDYQIQ